MRPIIVIPRITTIMVATVLALLLTVGAILASAFVPFYSGQAQAQYPYPIQYTPQYLEYVPADAGPPADSQAPPEAGAPEPGSTVGPPATKGPPAKG
jgi:hypothetical protein